MMMMIIFFLISFVEVPFSLPQLPYVDNDNDTRIVDDENDDVTI